MKILFVHDNFPAQFGQLGDYLRKRGWDVAFATQKQGVQAPGFRIINYKPHREPAKETHAYMRKFERATLNGQAFARSALAAKKSGFSPDIIMAHSGWGPGMFAKDIWPDAKYIGYFEWYYSYPRPDASFLGDEHDRDKDLDHILALRMQNAPIWADLAASDMTLCPTKFQASRFPEVFRDKMTVLHDGVDTELHAPALRRPLEVADIVLSPEDELITYATRGMEPHRGFMEFMTAAAEVLKRRPKACVAIAGTDRVAYGQAVKGGPSWKERALTELDLDMSRVHFFGLLPRAEYVKLLQASKAHVYLTAPFVLSWSLLEAMSAGALIVASNTEPVLEFMKDRETGLLCDFYDTNTLADRIIEALEQGDSREMNNIRAAARQLILDHYSARDIFERKDKMLMQMIGKA